MNVLLIAQCDKRALVESRRILDQFAERRGERTWQTPITQAGLDTLRKLLKKSARRNTAVACHWIRGKDHSELLWIVGDASRFNAQGAVPTNSTRRDVLRKDDENDWHSAEAIKLLAQMAALFHDVGKANAAFQAKLRGKGSLADAYRHEWVSLRLFEAFVGSGASDADWLQRLIDGDADWFARLRADHPQPQPSPFMQRHLPPLAQVIGWLIVSHHRLPSGKLPAAGLKLLPAPIKPDWCGARPDASPAEKAACWQFPPGHLPFASAAWNKGVAACAQAMLERPGLLQNAPQWLSDPYLMHLSRLVLMLADHHYSSLPSNARLGDAAFPAHANTDSNGALKQRLDEHLLGVAQGARRIVGLLPRLERSLPRIARHKGFKRRATDERFRWQDKAFDLACSLRETSMRQGFFGINLASTGCGKTLANGRILYALADPQRGARFSIALGLRTLTLQTGEAYREKLGLDEDDLAVRVGGTAVRELFELGAREQRAAARGSESAASLLDNGHVHYEANLQDGPLKDWLQRDPQAHKLVSAPVLACTVDHLIPACESTRGGRQIAPMLRLLTSDLVLDEPDDFDLADLPALTRLVHWAGLLGSRVLLSSATLPPALLRALFEAYSAGRAAYRQHRGEPGTSADICCAWFDEFTCNASQHADGEGFTIQHSTFINKRLAALSTQPVRRRARIVPLSASSKQRPVICAELAQQLPSWMSELHQRHHSTASDGRRVSFGLLRLANIDPLIELAQALHAQGAPEGVRLHLCVYHARFPLLLRSAIERQLDALLRRHDPQAVFDQPTVRDALARYPEADHLFVVLASPVAEVGRDHDYDWAIVEPSSMRSIIQLAGRIRRHRPGACEGDNLYLLSHNLKALQGEAQAFTRPGFESERLRLASHDLRELLPAAALAIDAAPRIVEASPLQPKTRLVDLEHARLRAELLGEGASNTELSAAFWWQTPAPLSGVMQNAQRFRKGRPQLDYALLPNSDDEPPYVLHRDEEDGTWRPLGNLLEALPLDYGPRIHRWGHLGYEAELIAMAEQQGLSLRVCAMRYGYLSLDCQHNDSGTLTDLPWRWHEALGFTRAR
ncbi:type I-F CRISPR-associated helicase Cas3f [Pseudomonas sp. NCHU5208]|uniref:type I-F CRISPR-associated helicase Cas3f n=1 Tax=unclassified Pseudomonas TaxID=196821 RepID=UPI003F9B68A3